MNNSNNKKEMSKMQGKKEGFNMNSNNKRVKMAAPGNGKMPDPEWMLATMLATALGNFIVDLIDYASKNYNKGVVQAIIKCIYAVKNAGYKQPQKKELNVSNMNNMKNKRKKMAAPGNGKMPEPEQMLATMLATTLGNFVVDLIDYASKNYNEDLARTIVICVSAVQNSSNR